MIKATLIKYKYQYLFITLTVKIKKFNIKVELCICLISSVFASVMLDLAINRENWWFGWPSGNQNFAIAMPTKTLKI